MEELVEYRLDILAALEAEVPQLVQLAAGIPADAWHIPCENNWHTPHFTLSRLLLLEDQVFTIYIRRIVEENTPLLPLFDIDAWLAEHYVSATPAQAMLDQFTHLRTQQVTWLRNLPRQAWSRTARHPWWGMRTLQWWVELQLDYTRRHLQVIATAHSH